MTAFQYSFANSRFSACARHARRDRPYAGVEAKVSVAFSSQCHRRPTIIGFDFGRKQHVEDFRAGRKNDSTARTKVSTGSARVSNATATVFRLKFDFELLFFFPNRHRPSFQRCLPALMCGHWSIPCSLGSMCLSF